MKSLAYKTQVIFFWLLVLVITFLVYTAKQKFLGLFEPVVQRDSSPDEKNGGSEEFVEKLPVMLNSTHMYHSVKKIINSTLGNFA